MRWRDDRGSSVVEFVLVSTLLILLLFGALQVALFVYVDNVVSAAAAEGARTAAALGSGPDDGNRRANEVLRDAVPGVGRRVTCRGSAEVDATSGLPVATVRCTGTLRAVLVPLRLPWRVDVASSVLREGQP
jgi:Flp pilus assembly protein TadG